MDLDLHDRAATQTVFNGGISVDNMTWWFWIKAGIGFTLGAGFVTCVSVVTWWYISMRLLAAMFSR
jgi:hypothetical protein